MSSTFGGLNILSRSLYASQASLDTVGHNIANAGTEGYSRQRVNLETAFPSGEVYGRNKNYSGSGVTVGSITRARDIFTDRQLWKETASLGYSQSSSEALSKLEEVFKEPSDTGIQTVLNQFWTSWQTLSTNASDSSARKEVAEAGTALVDSIKHAAQQLKDSAENVNFEVVSSVAKINQLTEGISELNNQIYFTEFSGTNHANDLRDSRDLLVDQLSKLVDVSVTEDSTGKYSIKSSGVSLVTTYGFTKLSTIETNNPPTEVYGYPETSVIVAETGKAVNFTNGEVKALIDSRDSETKGIKGYMDSLEKVSQFLLQDFNAVHRSGYGTDNINGRNFFGAASDTTDPTKDLDYAAAGEPAGGWINELLLNPDINTTNGLEIIAAKTTTNGVDVTLPITNTGSGVPKISTVTGTYSDGSATQTNVRVKITSIDSATGKVDGIKYSTDDGITWLDPISTVTDGKVDLSIAGLSFNLDASTLTDPAVGNNYKFSLSLDSKVKTPIVTACSKNIGSAVPTVTTTGTYTGGTNATVVRVRTTASPFSAEYSLDGGNSWDPLVEAPPGTYTLTTQGLTVNIPSASFPVQDNTYSFSLPGNNNASGDNAIKLGNRLKTDTSSVTLGNVSLDEYYSSLIGTLGIQSQDAGRTNTNQQTVIDQLTNTRQSTSGVNLDEEMTDMIRFQKSYNAAARVLTAMDEMLDKLINGTGAVGR